MNNDIKRLVEDQANDMKADKAEDSPESLTDSGGLIPSFGDDGIDMTNEDPADDQPSGRSREALRFSRTPASTPEFREAVNAGRRQWTKAGKPGPVVQPSRTRKAKPGPLGPESTPGLLGLIADAGTDYSVREVTSPDHLLDVCRVCGDSIPFPADPCEFAEGPELFEVIRYREQLSGLPVRYVEYGPGQPVYSFHRRPIVGSSVPTVRVSPGYRGRDSACECNGCLTKRRNPGQQPETCGTKACDDELRRRRQRARDERIRQRDRDTAREWLDAHPEASDEQIMEWTGITTRKRVTEARTYVKA